MRFEFDGGTHHDSVHWMLHHLICRCVDATNPNGFQRNLYLVIIKKRTENGGWRKGRAEIRRNLITNHIMRQFFNRSDDTLIEFSIRSNASTKAVRSHFDWQMSTALLFDNWMRNFHPVAETRQPHNGRSEAVRQGQGAGTCRCAEINRHRFRNFAEMRISTTHSQTDGKRFVCYSVIHQPALGRFTTSLAMYCARFEDTFRFGFVCRVRAQSKTINEINSTVVTTKLVKSTTTFALYLCHVLS